MPLSYPIGISLGLLGSAIVLAMVIASARLDRRYRSRKHRSCTRPTGGPHIPFLPMLAGFILMLASGCELDSIEFNPAVNVNSDQTTTTVTIVTNQPSTNVASEASSK